MEYAIEVKQIDGVAREYTVSLHKLLKDNSVDQLKKRHFICPNAACNAVLSVCYSKDKLVSTYFAARGNAKHISLCTRDGKIVKLVHSQIDERSNPSENPYLRKKGMLKKFRFPLVYEKPVENTTREKTSNLVKGQQATSAAQASRQQGNTHSPGQQSCQSVGVLIEELYENPAINKDTYLIDIPGHIDIPVSQCVRNINTINAELPVENIPQFIYYGIIGTHEFFTTGIKIHLKHKFITNEKIPISYTLWIADSPEQAALYEYILRPLRTAKKEKMRIYFFGKFLKKTDCLHQEIKNINLIHISAE